MLYEFKQKSKNSCYDKLKRRCNKKPPGLYEMPVSEAKAPEEYQYQNFMLTNATVTIRSIINIASISLIVIVVAALHYINIIFKSSYRLPFGCEQFGDFKLSKLNISNY
mmetsp:Transcript_10291/g.10272  ORF Transcript_10291/g.10272 Transcript_10291/m.10272 type:complete len:109 (+) Transcript_10291:987-1313(+)